jgi:hypothetical protein
MVDGGWWMVDGLTEASHAIQFQATAGATGFASARSK